MIETPKVTLPFRWVAGAGSRRPLRPSEHRVTMTGTRRFLPSARATVSEPRPLLPWSNLAGNDWRGVKPA